MSALSRMARVVAIAVAVERVPAGVGGRRANSDGSSPDRSSRRKRRGRSQPASSQRADPTRAPSAPTGTWRARQRRCSAARTGFDAVVLGDGTVLAVGDDFACHPGGAMPGSERAELVRPASADSLGRGGEPQQAAQVAGDGRACPMAPRWSIGGINSDDVPFSSTKLFSPDDADLARTGRCSSSPEASRIAAALADGRDPRRQLDALDYVPDHERDLRSRRSVVEAGRVHCRRPRTSTRSSPRSATVGSSALGFDHVDADPRPGGYLYDPRPRQAGRRSRHRTVNGYALAPLPDGGALAIGGTAVTGRRDRDPIDR